MKHKACRIVVLISGSGTNLQALIDAIDQGQVAGEITNVISNRPNAPGLKRAENAGISTLTLNHHQFSSRESFDSELLQQLKTYNPDLIVLAGFMRILSDELVTNFSGKMLNIHPSLLPKYRGLNTHQRALESDDTVHGASVHFVTPDLDGGPVVLQAKLTLRPEHTAEKLAQELLPLEHKIYTQSIAWFCAGKLQWHDNQVIFDQNPLSKPLLLENI